MTPAPAVAADGGEIGRAQAAQAEAAGVEPTVDMNPILLKPEGDVRAQLVVRGVAAVSVDFDTYQTMAPDLIAVVAESLERLRGTHDLVLIEGAGSPAEINLAEGADPQQILQACVGPLRIRRFELATPSLEQIFIDKVGDATLSHEGTR